MFSYGSGAVASMYVLKGRSGKIALSSIRPRSICQRGCPSASSGPRRSSRRATRARLPTGRRRSSLVEVCRPRRARSFCGGVDGRHRREYGRTGLVWTISHWLHPGLSVTGRRRRGRPGPAAHASQMAALPSERVTAPEVAKRNRLSVSGERHGPNRASAASDFAEQFTGLGVVNRNAFATGCSQQVLR